jgi:hypothetical protein
MGRFAVTVLQALFVLGLQSLAQAGDPPAPAKAETPAAGSSVRALRNRSPR